jgi:hypothetical protein
MMLVYVHEDEYPQLLSQPDGATISFGPDDEDGNCTLFREDGFLGYRTQQGQLKLLMSSQACNAYRKQTAGVQTTYVSRRGVYMQYMDHHSAPREASLVMHEYTWNSRLAWLSICGHCGADCG